MAHKISFVKRWRYLAKGGFKPCCIALWRGLRDIIKGRDAENIDRVVDSF